MEVNNERQPYWCVATGKKGVGKSHFTLNEVLTSYVKGGPNRIGRPVIIFDINNEYENIKDIYFDLEQYLPNENKNAKKIYDKDKIGHNIVLFCSNCYKGKAIPEIRRVRPFLKNGQPMGTAQKVATAVILMEKARGSLLLLEDINNYSIGARSIEFIGQITTNRHKGQDVICHFQSLSALDPRFLANVKVIRMHKQADSVERIVKKLNNPELFLLAECMVNSEYMSGNQYFFLYIYPEDDKIRFHNMEKRDVSRIFQKGCMDYLSEHPEVLKKLATIHYGITNISKLTPTQKVYLQNEFIKKSLHYITK